MNPYLTFTTGIVCLALSFGATPALAADETSTLSKSYANSKSGAGSSAWQKIHTSRVRLISGDRATNADDNSFYAGIQIRLEKGWKTYWRSPGDSGVPPHMDWSASRGIADVAVLYPAPTKYADQYSTSIGYKGEVVLPVRITPVDPQKTVELNLRLGYGICADICVPAEAELSLSIPPRQAGHASLLSSYQSRVPKSVKSTGKAIDGYAFEKIKIVLKGDAPHILVDALVPDNVKESELYATVSDGFYLPLAIADKKVSGPKRRFHIDLTKGDPPKDLMGRTLRLTLVGDQPGGEKGGIEVQHKIN